MRVPHVKTSQVTVMVYVDGVLVDEHTNDVPAFAVNYVAQAAIVQVAEPDLEAAEQADELAYEQV